MKVLFLSYDGLTDALGQSQILAYMKRLATMGHEISILSFDKADRYAEFKAPVQQHVEQAGIRWVSLPYHQKPPILSSLKDLKAGRKAIAAMVQASGPFDLAHCRGYMPAVLGRWMRQRWQTPFLFDMRGWWPDEKIESGHWASPIYRPVYHYFKRLERRFFAESWRTISLTQVGKAEIESMGYGRERPVAVIPTCVDFDLFKPFDDRIRQRRREAMGIPAQAQVLLYSGSLGGNYRTDLILGAFKAWKERFGPSAWMLFLTRSPRQLVEEAAAELGMSMEQVVVTGCAYAQVHEYLMAGDVGMILYGAGFSIIGRSPTKLGEYWSGGMPAVSVEGTGDLDALMERYPEGGTLVPKSESEDYQAFGRAFDRLLEKPVDRALLRQYALDYYDLHKGVATYDQLYRSVAP